MRPYKTYLLRFLLSAFLLLVAAATQAQDFSFTATPREGCSPLLVSFNFVNDAGRDLSSATFFWEFGNGNTSVLQNPSDSYTTPGFYTVSLTVDYFGDATDVQTVTYNNLIEVFPNPTPVVTVDGRDGCAPDEVTLDASGSLPNTGPGGSNTYNWSIGGIGSFGSVVVTEVFNTTTTVDLTVTNDRGCTAVFSETYQVTQPTNPDFTASPRETCNNSLNVNFFDNTTGITDPTNYTYYWDFGDGTTLVGSAASSTISDPTHTYTGSGAYTVQLVVENNNSGCRDTLVRDPYINLVDFQPDFSAVPVVGCAPLDVDFSNTSQNAVGGSSFVRPYQEVTWDFGDGTVITGAADDPAFLNPSHTYANDNQTYTATMTITDGSGNGCVGAVSRTVTTAQTPEASFSASQQNFCEESGTVNFTSTSTNLTPPVTYQWDFGDGSTANIANPSHTYNGFGTYDVSLIVTNANGCADTLQQNSYIELADPLLDFTANPADACAAPFTTSITDGSTSLVSITDWEWNLIDDGGTTVATSTDQNPDFTINTPGSYDVQLIASNAQCSDTLRRDDYLTLGGFQAQFDATPTSGCAGLTVNFENTSINPLNGNTFIRPYQTVTWDFGDGASVSGPATDPGIVTPNHTYTTPGTTYTVTMTVDDPVNGCNGSATTTVTTLEDPVPNFETDIDGLVFCDPTTPFSVDFTNTSTNLTPTVNYLWDFGNGTFSTDENPSVTYGAAGTYNVTLTVTNGNGCVESITIPVGIDVEVADLNVQPPAVGCVPLDETFTATYNPTLGVLSDFAWTVTGASGTVATSTTVSPTFDYTFTDPGDYVVNVAVSASGVCVEDTLRANTTAEVGDQAFDLGFGVTPTSICRGDEVTFSHSSSLTSPGYGLPTSFLWDTNGDGTYANVGTYDPNSGIPYDPDDYSTTFVFSNADTSSVSVSLITLSNGCADTLTRSDLISQESPVALFNTQIDTCTAPDTVRLLNNSYNYDSLRWIYTVNGTSDTIINVDEPDLGFTPADAGASVTIQLVLWNLGTTSGDCTDTLTQQVTLPSVLPEISFTADTTRGCAPLTVNFDADIPSATSYLWTFEGNGTSTQEDPSVTFTTADTFDIALSVQNAEGCTEDTTLTDYIVTYRPNANYTISGSQCAPTEITFTSTSSATIPIDSIVWDFGTGVTLSSVSPTLSPTATYVYDTALTPQTDEYLTSLVVFDTLGCSDQQQRNLSITNPNPDFTIDTTLVCDGSQYRFTAVNTDTSGLGLSYSWEVVGTNAQTFGNFGAFTATFDPGTDEIFLYVEDNNGCRDTISYVQNTPVATQPEAGFEASTTGLQCPPLTVDFTDTTTLGRAPIVQWTWDFGDGNPLVFTADTAFEFTYTQLGVYDVELQILDSIGCRDTVRVDDLIEIIGPIDTFQISRVIGYEPLDVEIEAFSNDPDYCYEVTFGDGTLGDYCPPPTGSGSPSSDTVRVFPHTYFTQNDTVTDYIPVAFITDRGASPSCRIGYQVDTVTVLPCPTLDVRDTSFCISEATSYTIVASNPTHAGDPVIYNWYDNSSGTFQIRPETTDRITIDTTDIGLGNAVSYVAQIYILDSGVVKCLERDTMQLLFDDAPLTDLGPDVQRCDAEGALTLDASQSGHNATTGYEWMEYEANGTTLVRGPVSGATITANHFSGDPLNPETHIFTVTILDTASSCEVFDTVRVTFRADPPVDIGPDIEVCDADVPVNLSAYNAAYSGVTSVSYQWTLIDTVNSTSTVIGTDSVLTSTIQTQNGLITNYQVIAEVIDDSAGCSSFDTVNVTLLVSPPVNLPDTVEFCAGDGTTLDAEDPSHDDDIFYNWFVNGTVIALPRGAQPELELTLLPGDEAPQTYEYVVQVTDTANNCVVRDTTIAIFNRVPDFDLPDTIRACDQRTDPVLDASDPGGNNLSYQWFRNGVATGVTTSTYTVTDTATNLATTTFTFSALVTDTLTGCSFRDSSVIILDPSPRVNLPDTLSLCDSEGDTLLYAGDTSHSSAVVYQWFRDGIDIGTGGGLDTIIVDVRSQSNATTSYLYTVQVTDSNTLCTTFDTTRIIYSPNPAANLPDSTIRLCDSEGDVRLSAYDPDNPSNTVYNWYVDGVLQSDFDSIFVFDQRSQGGVPTSYTLEVVLSIPTTGCDFRDSVEIIYDPDPVATLPDSIILCDSQGDTLINAYDTAHSEFFTYQWFQEGASLVGETDSVLNVTGLNSGGTSDTIRFEVLITDTTGCDTRDTTFVIYNTNPLVNDPVDTIFRCDAEGDTTLSAFSPAHSPSVIYEWTRDGVAFATGATITVTDRSEFVPPFDYRIYEYAVQITDTLTGCSNSAVRYIKYFPDPFARANPDTTRLCQGDADTVSFDSNPNGLFNSPEVVYEWYVDDSLALQGTDSSVFNLTGVFGGPVPDTIMVRVNTQDTSSCVNADTAIVIYTPNPVQTLADTAFQCDEDGDFILDASSPLHTPSTAYEWFRNGVSVGTGATFTVTDRSASFDSVRYEYVVVMRDTLAGCQNTDTTQVIYFPEPFQPVADTTLVCGSGSAVLDALHFSHDTAYTTYEWYANGTLVVPESPSASSYTTGPLATTPPDTTYYEYRIVIRDSRNGCVNDDTIIVGAAPGPLVSMPDTILRCDVEGDTTILASVSNATTGTTYQWYQDGTLQSDTDSLFLVDERSSGGLPTTYEYVVAVTDTNSCTVFDTTFVIYTPPPVVDLPDTIRLCDSEGDTLLDANDPTHSTLANYAWYDDGILLGGETNAILNIVGERSNGIMPDTSVYTVEVSDTTSCPTASDQAVVIYYPNPVVSLSSTVNACDSDPDVVLNAYDPNFGAFAQYEWYQDGVLQSDTDSAFAVTDRSNGTTPVTYEIAVVVTDSRNNCLSTDTAQVTYAPAPMVSLPDTIVRCDLEGDTLLNAFEPTHSASVTYNWVLDGVALPTSDATLTVDVRSQSGQPTTYLYTVEVVDTFACTTIDSTVVIYTPPPAVTLPDTIRVCDSEGDTLLNASDPSHGTFTSYVWYEDGVVIGGATDSLLTVTERSNGSTPDTTVFVVEVSDTTSCPQATDTAVVIYFPNPIVALGNDTTLCTSEGALTIDGTGSASGTAISYQWSELAGSTLTPIAGATNTTYTVAVPNLPRGASQTTTYVLEALNTVSACTDRDTIAVTYIGAPINALGSGDTAVCVSEGAATLDASGSASGTGITYQWYTFDGGTETPIAGETSTTLATSLPTLAPGAADSTTYIFEVNDSNTGCSTFDTLTLIYTGDPVAVLGADTTLCTSEGAVLLDGTSSTSGTTISYQWNELSGGTLSPIAGATGTSYAVMPFALAPGATQTQEYVLEVTDIRGNCLDQDTVAVTYIGSPVAELSNDTTLCVSDGALTVSATATAGATISYQWNELSGGTLTPIAGATGTSFTVSPFVVAPGGSASVTYVFVATDALSNCQSRDTVMVTYIGDPVVALGADTTLCVSEGALTISATATAGTTISYQWNELSGGTLSPIAGATSASYTVMPFMVSAGATQTQSYVLEVTDSRGTCVAFDTIVVSYVGDPLTALGADTTLCVSDGALTVSATATAGATISYQWNELSGGTLTPIAGATSTSYTVMPFAVTAGDAVSETYVLVTTDARNSCQSQDTITVTYVGDPLAVANDTAICFSEFQNGPLVLDGTASTSGTTITYQWYEEGFFGFTPIAGATAPTFGVSPTAPAFPGDSVVLNFVLEVSDLRAGCTDTDTVRAVYYGNAIAFLGTDQQLCENTPATLDANGFGVNPTTTAYDWFVDGVQVVSGATNSTYTFTGNAAGGVTTTYQIVAVATDTNTNCGSADTVLITYPPAPTASIPIAGGLQVVCGPQSVSLDASVPANSSTDDYEWTGYFGTLNGSNVTIPPPASTITSIDTFDIVLTVTDTDGCFNRDTAQLVFGPVPVTNLPNNPEECLGRTFTLNADPAGTNLPSVEYVWTVNGAVVQSGTSPTYDLLITDTTFNVSVVATDQITGCTSNDATLVSPLPLPITAQIAPIELCDSEGDTLINATHPSHTAATQYQWYLDGVLLAGENNPVINVTGLQSLNGQPTTYEYVVEVTDPNTTCEAFDTTRVTYYPVPVLNFVEGSRIFTCAVDGDVVLDAQHPTHWPELGYVWWSNALLGDNVPAQGPTLTIPGGTFTSGSPVADITLEITDSLFGCNTSVYFELEFEPNPAVTGLPEDTTLCVNQGDVPLTGTVNFELNPDVTYTWFDETGVAVGSSPTFNAPAPTGLTAGQVDEQTYTLEVESLPTGCIGTASTTVRYLPEPVASISNAASSVCQSGTPPTLDGRDTTHGADIRYFWEVLDEAGNVIEDFDTPTITPDIPSVSSGSSLTYTYVLQVRRAGIDGCISTDRTQITFFPTPAVDLGDDLTRCEGDVVVLDAGVAGSASITWTFNGAAFSATGTTVSVTQTGTYGITVSDTDGNCSSSDEIQVTFTPVPEPEIRGHDPQAGTCAETDTLELQATNLADFEVRWSGPGIVQNDTLSVIVDQSGTYTVTVRNPVTGCASTTAQQVVFNTVPVVDLGEDRADCAGGNGFILDVADPTHDPAAIYTWTENGTTLTATSASITVNASGTNTYTVTVENPTGCSASDVVQLTINPNPDIGISGGGSPTCEDSDVLTANGTLNGLELAWLNASGDTLGTDPSYTATQSGTYTLAATNAQTGCTSSATQSVILNPDIAVSIPASSTVCENTEITLDASDPTHVAGNTEYVWTLLDPDGAVELSQSASDASLVITQSDVGNYQENQVEVRVTNTLTDCVARDTITVQFDRQPVAATLDNAEICIGASVTLDGTSAVGASLRWFPANDPDTTLSTEPQLIVQPNQTTAYGLAVLSGNACASTQTTALVSVNPLPVTDVTQSPSTSSVCVGDAVTLTATGGTSYNWSNGATGSTIVITPQRARTQLFVEVTTAAGCTALDSITVNAVGQEFLDEDLIACDGDELEIGTTSQYAEATYRWEDGSTDPIRTVTTSGTYTLTTTVGTCQSTQTYTADFRPIPTDSVLRDEYNFCFDPVALPDTTYILTAQVSNPDSADTYFFEWTDQGGSVESRFADFEVQRPGTYYLTIRSRVGCESRDTVEITGNCPPRVFVPTAFSPNGDGNNEVFEFFGSHLRNIRFSVYNRWGEVIFILEAERLSEIGDDEWWNGLHQNFGKAYPPGVYQWTLEYGTEEAPRNTQRRTGRLTLIR